MHDRKSLDCLEEKLTTGKASNILENIYIFHEHNVRNMKAKCALVRLQIEMRNMLLKNEGKIILIIEWQRTWQNYVLLFSDEK